MIVSCLVSLLLINSSRGVDLYHAVSSLSFMSFVVLITTLFAALLSLGITVKVSAISQVARTLKSPSLLTTASTSSARMNGAVELTSALQTCLINAWVV